MSIEQAKKQAKNLRRLLPDFIAAHPDGGKLADYQELIARTHGYPSFHAMSESKKESESSLGPLFVSYRGIEDWNIYDSKGNSKIKMMPFASLRVPTEDSSDEDSLHRVIDKFDEECDIEGSLTGDFGDYSQRSLNKLLRLAKKLTQQKPAFVDGWAFQAGVYVHTGQNLKAIHLAEPLVAKILGMITCCAKENKAKILLIPYPILPNRPFYRLAHSLVLAYLGEGKTEKGVSLAKKMFSLWPNDNMGFRFIINDHSGAEGH